jgi:DNA-binding MarR family transcriptional regulator
MKRMKQASLAEALQQTRPFAGVEQEAYLSILRTATELSHWTDQLLKSHGVTQAQYNVLRILRGAGADGLCRNQIAGRLVTAMPDVSRLLDRMEEAGWIERERGREDRRQVAAVITVAGTRLLAKLDAPLEDLHRAQFAKMGKGELKQLLATLTAVRERIPE